MSLDLLDYRRQVFAHYREVRESGLDRTETAERFRHKRNQLFSEHPQSALDTAQKGGFSGLEYFDYDPSWRKLAELDFDVALEEIEIPLREDGVFRMRPYALAHFEHEGRGLDLTVYWISGYGGGLFLPFRDETRRTGETYPGTRYLLDTIKGADLGVQEGKLILDFNYAYNPSCAYNPKWDCPLAPQENWLEISIPAGEKDFPLS